MASVIAGQVELAAADYGFHVAQHADGEPTEADAVRLVSAVLEGLLEAVPGEGPLIVFTDGRIERGPRAILEAHEALADATADLTTDVDPVNVTE